MTQTPESSEPAERPLGERRRRLLSVPIAVTVVSAEEKPGLFGATVVGLEDTIAATGPSRDEAEASAAELFANLVLHEWEPKGAAVQTTVEDNGS